MEDLVMRKFFTIFLVLSAFILPAVAETDYLAIPMIRDIQNGVDNANKIETLRATDAVIEDDASVGGDAAIVGNSAAATYTQTSVNGAKMLQYAKFSFTQASVTAGTHAVSCAIPNNAIIADGFLWLDTVICSDTNLMELSIGVNADANLLASVNTPTNGLWTANAGIAFIPRIATPTTFIKMTSSVSSIRFVTTLGSATGTVSGTGYISYFQGD